MTSLILIGIVLILPQVLAAIPWVIALNSVLASDRRIRWIPILGGAVALTVVGGIALGFGIDFFTDPDALQGWGKAFAAIFQIQVFVDLFLLTFFLLHQLWPKGAAVARAAFREGYRQPMFWLVALLGLALICISPYIPYFTFGEDYLIVQEIGYDAIILSAALFGVLAASMSIAEEIEGRTAVTLMSKPVSRRQFLIGKFVGLFLVCMLLVAVLGLIFEGILMYKHFYDEMDPIEISAGVQSWLGSTFQQPFALQFMSGVTLWGHYVAEVVPGLVKAGSVVMVLVAIAVMLATRLPMIINLVVCLMIYFMANLMPVLVDLTAPGSQTATGTVQQLLHFVAQLFDAILPGLEILRVNPTLVGVNSVSLSDYITHVLSAGFYGVLYTSIILILGLILFEDRDLA